MGEEPLEVPRPNNNESSSSSLQLQQQHHHTQQTTTHNNNNHSYLYPERFFHDATISSSTTRSLENIQVSLSREKISNAYGSTAQVSAANNKPTTPRRVRHRVDAGEPRGCFSNTSPSNTWGRLPFGNTRFHPHFLPPPHLHQFVYTRTPPPPPLPPPNLQVPVSPQPPVHHHHTHHQYFERSQIQPMKMLSEFISSVTPTNATSRDNQLLLREMLCKNAQNNNEYEHSQTTKSKLDGMVSIMMEKLSNTPEPEVNSDEPECINANSSTRTEANAMGDDTEPNKQHAAAADLLNNNTQGQKNKRKKYQPQKTDLVELQEHDKIDEDDEIVEESSGYQESKVSKRKLDEYSDLDEEEALMLRIQSSRSSAATTNPDDLECEFENEEDEQEAMINDDLNHDKVREQDIGSRRTLPVVRNLMKERKHEAAPLTRSLLTTRITPTPPPPPPPQNPPSSQTPSISNNEKSLLLHPEGLSPNSSDFHSSPPPFLNAWKENLKSTLITHINELVEAQFSLLLGGGMMQQQQHHTPAQRVLPQQDPNRLRESNMKEKSTPNTPPHTTQPKPLHLNGGSVLNTEKMIPREDVKKLPVSRSSENKPQDYPNTRGFPFLHDKSQRLPPPFSTALVGLSNAHNNGIENMFDNDGALSLVVGKEHTITPRKKRHKVTDTRLTPRAVSRLLNQEASSSPCYEVTSPNSSPSHVLEPRSILQNGTPPPRDRVTPATQATQAQPQQTDQLIRNNFNPFVPPQTPQGFFHHGIPHPLSHHLGRLESPPMGNSLLHPALQNPSEYVERLREMSQEQEARNGTVVVRERTEHHGAGIREYPSVRGLRDRGTGGSMMLTNEVLDLIGRSGSAGGSDSDRESGSQFEMSSSGGMYCHTTSTLTPMHLRKAKLMFFWTRYPSSAVIKMYFPDIKFNKNNTAQLVKWFSNFREFYYIQMEKYARQALSEGVKQSEDLVVTNDSELYRVLNLHYNRNNHIEVPSNFRYVVEQTLREFFKSIQAGKDAEQSWKKAIYKIIARLDDPVPEYFKSPNFLEQLE